MRKTQKARQRDAKEQVTVILPKERVSFGQFRELWQYRELIRMLIRRDYKTMYAQTILGPAWFLLTAVLTSGVMTLVFGGIAGISTDGTPRFLFYFLGTLLWNDFAGCVSGASATFTRNVRLMGKVWFPRLCVPIAEAASRQIRFLIQLALFVAVYLVYLLRGAQITPSWQLLLTPFLLLELIVLAVGCGLIVAALTTRYRDLGVLVTFLLQIWMYATPVVYPLSQIPQSLRTVMLLNPVAPILETFRSLCFGNSTVPFASLLLSVGVTFVLAVIGMFSFQRAQRSFADTI